VYAATPVTERAAVALIRSVVKEGLKQLGPNSSPGSLYLGMAEQRSKRPVSHRVFSFWLEAYSRRRVAEAARCSLNSHGNGEYRLVGHQVPRDHERAVRGRGQPDLRRFRESEMPRIRTPVIFRFLPIAGLTGRYLSQKNHAAHHSSRLRMQVVAFENRH
jgi:hypothetical protein